MGNPVRLGEDVMYQSFLGAALQANNCLNCIVDRDNNARCDSSARLTDFR
jgi:hypothetical protein